MHAAALASLLLGGLLLPDAARAVDPNPARVDPQSGDGCWVRFFDERGFRKPIGRLAGNLYINSIEGPGLIGKGSDKEFLHRSESLVVGPEARLIAYEEPGFRKELVDLGPGRKVSDLARIGLPARIASLKISCTQGS